MHIITAPELYPIDPFKSEGGQGQAFSWPTPGFFKFYQDSKIDGGLVGPLGEDSWAASSERETHRS